MPAIEVGERRLPRVPARKDRTSGPRYSEGRATHACGTEVEGAAAGEDIRSIITTSIALQASGQCARSTFLRASASASAFGIGTGLPITGSTVSANLAGCAVARNRCSGAEVLECSRCGLRRQGSQSPCADRPRSRNFLCSSAIACARRSSVCTLVVITARIASQVAIEQPLQALEDCSAHRRPWRWPRSRPTRAVRRGPSARYRGTVSLTWSAATNPSIGAPICHAITPADQVAEVAARDRDHVSGAWRLALQRGVGVVEHLRHAAGPG